MADDESRAAGVYDWPEGVARNPPSPAPRGWHISKAGRAYHAARRAAGAVLGSDAGGAVAESEAGEAGAEPEPEALPKPARARAKTRRRPAGASAPRRKTDADGPGLPVDSELLAKRIKELQFLSMLFPAPELRLTEEEAAGIAEASLVFQSEFNVTMSPKLAAAIGLGAAVIGTFRPKLGAVRRRVMQQRARQQEEANPMHFRGTPAQPWDGPKPGVSEPQRPPGPATDGVIRMGGESIILTPGSMPDGGAIKFN